MFAVDGPTEGFNNAISVQPTFSTKMADFKPTDGKEALEKIIGLPKRETTLEPRLNKKRGPVVKEQLGSLGYRKKKKKHGEKEAMVGFEFVGGVTMSNKRHELAKPFIASAALGP